MKTFKILLAVAISGSMLLTSCTKEDGASTIGKTIAASQSEEVESYPAAIDDYVAENYPNETIIKVEEETHDETEIVYEVKLTSGIELVFDEAGMFLYSDEDFDDEEEDEIDPSALPQNIIDYIFSNYAEPVIVEAEMEDEGYEVELSDGTELLFDIDGNFIAEDQDEEDEIEPTDLPQEILDYIATNYPGTEVSKAEFDNDEGYEVKLSDGTELYFDVDGNFLGTDEDDNDNDDEYINPADLPQQALDYIASNYPEASIVEAELEEGEGYEVELDNDIEIEFDLDGNVLEDEGLEDDSDDDEDDEDEDNEDEDNEDEDNEEEEEEGTNEEGGTEG